MMNKERNIIDAESGFSTTKYRNVTSVCPADHVKLIEIVLFGLLS